MGARAAVSCVTVHISLHTGHTIGRYDLLPAKFATLQDSVFTQKRQSKLPRKALDVSVKGHKKEKHLLLCKVTKVQWQRLQQTGQMYRDWN